jgi:type I restriction enzyme S subunit
VVLYGGHTRRVKHVSHPFVPGPNVKILTPISGLDSKFLYYFLRQLPIESKGYADHFPLVRKFDVPVPPLAEQQRIVRLLDEAFKAIAIANANAEKNIQNARRLFESQLQSLFTQRQTRWEETVLEDVTKKITDGSHNPPSGVPVSQFLMLSSKNVFDDALDYLNPRYLSAENFDLEHKRTGIIPGDVLLTIVGTIGRCAVVPDGAPQITLQRSVAVIRPDQARLASRFLMYSLMSRRAELNEQSRGVAQKGIYLESLRNFSVMVPTLEEQVRIVGTLDQLQDHTNQLAKNYTQKAKSLNRIGTTLLHQAFSGKLAVA